MGINKNYTGAASGWANATGKRATIFFAERAGRCGSGIFHQSFDGQQHPALHDEVCRLPKKRPAARDTSGAALVPRPRAIKVKLMRVRSAAVFTPF